jgi:hypothetical protein
MDSTNNHIINVLSNTLMKLAKGSKLRLTKFQLDATGELQTSLRESLPFVLKRPNSHNCLCSKW